MTKKNMRLKKFLTKEDIMGKFNILLSGKDIYYLSPLGNQKQILIVQNYLKNSINQTKKLIF